MEVRVRRSFVDKCLGQLEESGLNILTRLCTGHKDTQTSAFFKLFDLLLRHFRLKDALFHHVNFIGDHGDLDISLTVFFYFGDPVIQVKETLPLIEVKDQKDAFRALVVSIGNCAVAFLSRCVPNLQLHFSVAVVERSESEIHTNSGNVILVEFVIRETDKGTGLTD